MTTIHAYTQDQNLQDVPHSDLPPRARRGDQPRPDLDRRRARDRRACCRSSKGKLDGVAVRAPDPDRLGHRPRRRSSRAAATADEVNAAFEAAAAERRRSRATSSTRPTPLVSTDINQSPYSCIFDSELTMASGTTAKVFGWYDNEWGYSCRLVDLVNIVGKSL